jgi:hypothetical protein
MAPKTQLLAKRLTHITLVTSTIALAAVTLWLANPFTDIRSPPPGLRSEPPNGQFAEPYTNDMNSLITGFQSQTYLQRATIFQCC